MSELLSVEDVESIADSILWRQNHWTDEPLKESIMVVLFNCGDSFVEVRCLDGEWAGTKKDLGLNTGVPHCPNGHVLFETSSGKRLEWVSQ